MKGHLFRGVLAGFVLVGLASVLSAQPDDGSVPIQVAPGTLNLRFDGVWVTVHADIPMAVVDGKSVTLNGVAARSTFADACGNLVGKFAVADLVEADAVAVGESVEMWLDGVTKAGESFSGVDYIRVIDRGK